VTQKSQRIKRRGRPARRMRWGRVRELPSGRWQARVPDPTRLGRLVPAPQTFATRVDAERWLAEQETDQARGAWVDPSAGRITLKSYSEDWLAHRPDLRLRTIELYEGLLDRQILPTLGEVELSRLTTARVRTWRARLLKQGTGASTVAKAYRLLRAMFNTAVADELVVKNPCRIDGAGVEKAPERPVATIAEVEALADAMPLRFRLLILLAAWCTARRGELLALQRSDFDLLHDRVQINKAVAYFEDGTFEIGNPKTDAGRRQIAIPPHILPDVVAHLEAWVSPEPDAYVFTGMKGGLVRPAVLQTAWNKARIAVGRTDLHFHDLRHTGNTLAAAVPGTSTKDLMARMGQSSSRAALLYQHASSDRDAIIAAALSKLARPAKVTPIGAKRTRRGARGGHGDS